MGRRPLEWRADPAKQEEASSAETAHPRSLRHPDISGSTISLHRRDASPGPNGDTRPQPNCRDPGVDPEHAGAGADGNNGPGNDGGTNAGTPGTALFPAPNGPGDRAIQPVRGRTRLHRPEPGEDDRKSHRRPPSVHGGAGRVHPVPRRRHTGTTLHQHDHPCPPR